MKKFYIRICISLIKLQAKFNYTNHDYLIEN